MMDYEPYPGVPRGEQLRRMHAAWASRGRHWYGRHETDPAPLEDNKDDIDAAEAAGWVHGTTRHVCKPGVYSVPGIHAVVHPYTRAIKSLRVAVYAARAKARQPLFA